jgi:hypothetical protein
MPIYWASSGGDGQSVHEERQHSSFARFKKSCGQSRQIVLRNDRIVKEIKKYFSETGIRIDPAHKIRSGIGWRSFDDRTVSVETIRYIVINSRVFRIKVDVCRFTNIYLGVFSN